MSRTALDGFVMEDVEKDFLLRLVKRLSGLYFAEIMGFCLMGNHFHLVIDVRTCKDLTALGGVAEKVHGASPQKAA